MDILEPTTRKNWAKKLRVFIDKRRKDPSAGLIKPAAFMPEDLRRIRKDPVQR